MIYVGSAESSEYDQVLDSIMVGPVPVGVNKFIFAVMSLLICAFFVIIRLICIINFYRLMRPRLNCCPKQIYWKLQLFY